MSADLTNAEAVRTIVEPSAKAAASVAVRAFVQSHPHFAAQAPKPETPAYVKSGAGISITPVSSAAILSESRAG